MFFKDRLLSLKKIAVLLHKVAAGKLPLIVTSCQTSCVKPHYTSVPRSVPRSCVPAFTVARACMRAKFFVVYMSPTFA